MIAPLKASRSSGPREVIRGKPLASSTTTSSSDQLPPALTRSVRIVGTEVSFWPSTRPASISVQGAWQIAATGLPARSEEHTSELQSRGHLVCRLLLETKKKGER